MTRVYTAPFPLVRRLHRSEEALRFHAHLRRCQQVVSFILFSLVALLSWEAYVAHTLGIPLVPLY